MEESFDYNVKTRNCEHLAFECILFVPISPQMWNRFKKFVAPTLNVTSGIVATSAQSIDS